MKNGRAKSKRSLAIDALAGDRSSFGEFYFDGVRCQGNQFRAARIRVWTQVAADFVQSPVTTVSSLAHQLFQSIAICERLRAKMTF
jgi:hypothetical protein